MDEIRTEHRSGDEPLTQPSELERLNAELLRTKAGLEEQLALYRDLFDAAPVAYLTLDRAGVIQAVNASAASLFGLDRARLTGRPFGEFVSGVDRAAFDEYFAAVFSGTGSLTCVVTLQNDGSDPHIVQLRARPDADGRECRLALIDITDYTLAEQQNAHLASFPQLNPNPVLEVDSSGGITFTNPASLRILESLGLGEMDAAAFIPQDLQDIINGWDGCNEVTLYREIALQDRCFGETVCLIPDFNTVRIYAFDITERKRAEQALQESERIYRAIGESIDYGVWSCAPDGRNTYASKSFLKLVGITQEHCSNFGWGDVLHPDDMERTMAAWKKCVQDGGIWDIEHRFRGVDGRWHPVLARGVPVRDDAGVITCWAGINLDISRIKEAEFNLRESEERHRLLAETMLQGVVHQAADGTIISMNPAAELILGKSREELLGNTSIKVEHDTIRENGENFPGNEHPTMVALQTGQPVQGVVMGVYNPRLDQYRWINIDAVPVFHPNDTRPSEVYSVFEDITERMLDAETLRKKEERLRLALEAAKMAAWDWHVPSGSVTWNDMHFRMLGYTPGEVQPSYQAWADRVHPDDIEAVQRKIMECMAGGLSYSAEFRTRWPDGTIRWLEARGEIEYNTGREPQHFYGVMLDTTNRKRSEETLIKLNEELENRVAIRTAELRDMDRLLLLQSRQAAMGEMIGNIAHQWRQPLNILAMQVQQLLMLYDHGAFTREILETNVSSSMEQIQHMSSTINDFRNYFRPDKGKTEFGLSKVIANTLSLIEDSFRSERISIEVRTIDEPVITGYMNEFAQVILNILNNARDVLIEREISAPRVTISTFSENNRAVVTIADNAGGIREEIMDKVFDPYFTTKGPQTGTGVGLFMSKSIIEKNMGGQITVHNTDIGAEFRIEV